MNPAPMPHITALYAGLFALFLVLLGLRVVMLRRSFKVGIGDGGEERLARAIRAHGNAVEWGVLGLVLLLIAELNRASGVMLHSCGTIFFLARVLHAFGLTRSHGRSLGRVLGTIGTIAIVIILALWDIGAFVRVASVL
jgi:uncharacterized protein